jgi:membrane-bound metal-dependent hydrolase YbcI (DUF457 family)
MNAKEHGCLGAVAGAGYTIFKYLKNKEEDSHSCFPLDQLVINVLLGIIFATLPDWLEPATNPNHRKFLHSFTMGGLVIYGMYGNHIQDIDDKTLNIIRSIGFSYLSHLVADSTTPKSIPLIHPKIA